MVLLFPRIVTVTHVIDIINLTPWYPESDSFQNDDPFKEM